MSEPLGISNPIHSILLILFRPIQTKNTKILGKKETQTVCQHWWWRKCVVNLLQQLVGTCCDNRTEMDIWKTDRQRDRHTNNNGKNSRVNCLFVVNQDYYMSFVLLNIGLHLFVFSSSQTHCHSTCNVHITMIICPFFRSHFSWCQPGTVSSGKYFSSFVWFHFRYHYFSVHVRNVLAFFALSVFLFLQFLLPMCPILTFYSLSLS